MQLAAITLSLEANKRQLTKLDETSVTRYCTRPWAKIVLLAFAACGLQLAPFPQFISAARNYARATGGCQHDANF